MSKETSKSVARLAARFLSGELKKLTRKQQLSVCASCVSQAEFDNSLALKARIAKLEKRLEIDHAYRSKNGKMVRFTLTPKERETFPDAVECRDATIALLKDDLKEYRRADKRTQARKRK